MVPFCHTKAKSRFTTCTPRTRRARHARCARRGGVAIHTHLLRQQRLKAKEAEARGRAGDDDELPLAAVLHGLLKSRLVGWVWPFVVLGWLLLCTIASSGLHLSECTAASPLKDRGRHGRWSTCARAHGPAQRERLQDERGREDEGCEHCGRSSRRRASVIRAPLAALIKLVEPSRRGRSRQLGARCRGIKHEH